VFKKRAVEQFSALGQEDRLEIFRLLVRAGPGGKCVEDIKRRLKTPGSTLSHHLDALTRSGLIIARRSGRFIFYGVNWRETANLIRFLTEDCCAEMHTGLATIRTSEEPEDRRSASVSRCGKEEPIVLPIRRTASSCKGQ
jgi:DNA-binding transcriptional ArsR family regulator